MKFLIYTVIVIAIIAALYWLWKYLNPDTDDLFAQYGKPVK